LTGWKAQGTLMMRFSAGLSSKSQGSLHVRGIMLLHPQVIEKEGRKEFVVLPYEEFIQIQEAFDDLEDLRELRKERDESQEAPTNNLREIGKELGSE
jgi:hypothetical protein